MVKPETFFDIYEKTKPTEVKVEEPKEDKLFESEEKVEVPEQKITLPEGFEENLINKIASAVLEKIKPQEGSNDGSRADS